MPFGISFFIPPLRYFVTPLLKERLSVWLPLRGAVNAVDCGVACSYFHMTVIFLSYPFPPLRHFVTPLLKERLFLWLQLRGAVNAVDCGVAYSHFHMTVIFYRNIFHHSVTLWHLSSRRGFCMAPIEGSCQLSWLWGGLFTFLYDCNFLSYRFPPLRHFVTPLLKERLLYGFYWGEPATQDFMPTYPRKKGIIVDNPF